MSGFPKGFRISKASLVNVFLEEVFLNATCNAMQGWDEQNDMTWWGGLKQSKKLA